MIQSFNCFIRLVHTSAEDRDNTSPLVVREAQSCASCDTHMAIMSNCTLFFLDMMMGARNTIVVNSHAL